MSERRISSPLAASGALLAGLALVGLAHGYARSHRGDPPEPEILDAGVAVADAGGGEVSSLLAGRPLDVNRATQQELELLPRIGPTLAARIVEERERGGPYRSLTDLTRLIVDATRANPVAVDWIGAEQAWREARGVPTPVSVGEPRTAALAPAE